MKTKVVNINTNKGPYVFTYIGRGTFCGNPFIIGCDGTRKEVMEKYRKWFKERLKSLSFKAKIKRLKGRTLGCHCKPKACHGDIIINYLEGE